MPNKTSHTQQKKSSLSGEELEKEKKTLDHTPVLSEDFEIFSFHHEHNHAQEKKRKKRAVIALSSGVFALFAIGVIGFFSTNPALEGRISASIFSISSSKNFPSCIKEVQKLSSSEVERSNGEKLCKEKFFINTF